MLSEVRIIKNRNRNGQYISNFSSAISDKLVYIIKTSSVTLVSVNVVI